MIKLDNPKFLQAIKLLKEKPKSFVFIIGAGMSAPSGIPTWSRLAERLSSMASSVADQIDDEAIKKVRLEEINSAKSSSDLWKSLDCYKRILGAPTFNRELKEQLNAEQKDIPERYKQMWRIGPSGCVNFNLDQFAAYSYAKMLKPVPNLATFKERSRYENYLRMADPFIYHPHGYLDQQDTWLMTKSDRNDKDNRKYFDDSINFLIEIFLNRNTFIVGFNPEDFVFQIIQELSLNRQFPLRNDHFILCDRPSEDFTTDYEDKGFTVLPYFKGNESHPEIEEFFDSVIGYDPESSLSAHSPSLGRLEGIDYSGLTDSAKDINVTREKLNAEILDITQRYEQGGKEQSDALLGYYRENLRKINDAWLIKPGSEYDTIFDYQVDYQLGKGAFGTVFHAHSISANEDCAIKILLQNVMDDRDFLRTFRRGARSLKILTDAGIPGVVRFIESFEIPACIVMEYVPGFTLRQAMEQNALSIFEKIKIVSDIGKIVESGHALEQTVLHRDLKPDNVMLRDFYQAGDEVNVVVLDFDLSWHKGASDLSVIEGARALGYAAPEQTATGSGKSGVTSRSTAVDVFGLGMVFFYCLMRRDPRSNEQLFPGFFEGLRQQVRSELPSRFSSLSTFIAELIQSAVKDAQAERIGFDSFVESVSQVLAYLREEPVAVFSSIFLSDLVYRISDPDRATVNRSINEAVVRSVDGLTVIDLSFSVGPVSGEPVLNMKLNRNRGEYEDRNAKVTLAAIKQRLEAVVKRYNIDGKVEIVHSAVTAVLSLSFEEMVSVGDSESAAEKVLALMSASAQH